MNDALIVRVTGEENGQMQLEEIERRGLFLQRMDDSGEWFRYHPLFGSFLRQRCQWSWRLNYRDPPRRGGKADGNFSARPSTMRWRPAMPNAARYLVSNHAWACLTIAFGATGAAAGGAAMVQSAENPRLILLQAWLMQSQHRYSEPIPPARAEQR